MKPVHWLLPFKSRSGHHVELAVVSDEKHAGVRADLSENSVLVIVCHGKERDAEGMLRQVPQQLQSKPDVIVVAPRFINGLDRIHGERLLVWKGNEWGEGGASHKPAGAQVSSFEAVDALIAHYHHADRVFLVGHSLGAQLVQRYTVLGAGSRTKTIGYVIMNPSTYLFLNDRPYKYGLRDRQSVIPSSYTPAHCAKPDLLQRLGRRRVFYLNGSKDNGVGDDRDEAIRQGCNRPERAAAWQAHLSSMGIHSTDTQHVIAGVGHDAGHMMASAPFLSIFKS